MNKPTIQIVMIIDNTIITPPLVMLQSLWETNHKIANIIVNIITYKLDKAKESLLKGFNRSGFEIQIYDSELKSNSFYNYSDNGQFSSAVILKWYIPNILNHLDKVLYVDYDILVKSSLLQLWNENIDDVYAAVVQEPHYGWTLDIVKESGLNNYFNSGVMLFNLDKMRKDDILSKLLDSRIKYHFCHDCIDQNGFNVVLKDHVKFCDFKWNCTLCTVIGLLQLGKLKSEMKARFNKEYSNYSDIDVANMILSEAAIMHFAAVFTKPWHNAFNISYEFAKNAWLDVYSRTPNAPADYRT